MEGVFKQIEELGAMVRNIRLGKGISQRKLSEMTGVPANTISLFERNKCAPSLETLLKILDGLGYKIDVAMK